MTQYINRGMRPGRFGFGEALRDAAQKHPQLLVLGSDITSSVSTNLFAEAFPNRFISLGIAEQNAVGVAAGLALEGKIPVFSTYGVFAALRPADQIRVSLCYNNLHVIIGGAHAGVSVGPDGATHQALEDIAMMRSLPKMTVLSPCDATQTYLATYAAIEQIKGPVYIRFGREPVPDFTMPSDGFIVGKAQRLRDGNDIAIVATGHMVWHAIIAAEMLESKGIFARVINLHTIKPIDEQALIEAAHDCGAVITVEEHQVMGGMGSAVAEVLAQNLPVPMRLMGIHDHFGESGTADELMHKFGLDADHICLEAIELLKKRK